MSGTMIKHRDGDLFDVLYDEENSKFIVCGEDNLGGAFTQKQFKFYIEDGQIEIYRDKYNVIKKNIE